jgi:hypothetical protein
MNYFIIVQQQGKIRTIRENILDGLIPARIIAMTSADFADEQLELCETCNASGTCHVMIQSCIESNAYEHYCPMLFHDVMKHHMLEPAWTPEQLV